MSSSSFSWSVGLLFPPTFPVESSRIIKQSAGRPSSASRMPFASYWSLVSHGPRDIFCWLRPSARLSVVSFRSLLTRIMKLYFKSKLDENHWTPLHTKVVPSWLSGQHLGRSAMIESVFQRQLCYWTGHLILLPNLLAELNYVGHLVTFLLSRY